MLARLDHVILAVGDLEAATRSYARLLGRSPSWRGEHPGAGSVNALFRLENITLELLAPAGEGPVGAAVCAWLSARGEGPLGLAFGTDDAETCRGWLAARGLDPGAVEKGMGRDVDSGAFREWLRVPIPLTRTRGVPIFAIERLSAEALLPSAAALGDEAAAVHALDHAVVRTADPEAARALYGEALGLRLALDREFAQWGVRLLFFRVGGVTVELAAALPGATVYPTHPEGAEAPASREPREGGAGAGAPAGSDTQRGPEARAVREGGDRLWGLSWRVRDADGARARLASAGFSVSEVRPGRRPGTRVFGVRDGTHGVPTLVLEPEAR